MYAECHNAVHNSGCLHKSIILSFTTLNVTMLSVITLNVVMLSVITLNVVMLSVITLNVVMLSVVTLNVVMLSVVTPAQLNGSKTEALMNAELAVRTFIYE